MDSIGDVLYLIFIAIVAIVSLFSGKKKKHSTDKPVVIMEENFPPIPMQPRVKEKDKALQDLKKAKAPVPFLSGESSIEHKDYKSIKKHQQMAEEAIPEIEELYSEEFQLETMEDVRKGIVYSEIFNRRY
jgi:hypothetical protein